MFVVPLVLINAVWSLQLVEACLPIADKELTSLLTLCCRLSSTGRFLRLYLQRRLSRTCLWSFVWLGFCLIFIGVMLSVYEGSLVKNLLLLWMFCGGCLLLCSARFCSHAFSVPRTATALIFFLTTDWSDLSWTFLIAGGSGLSWVLYTFKISYSLLTFSLLILSAHLSPAPSMPLRSLIFWFDYIPCANLICVELAGSALARVSSSSSCCCGTEEMNLSWWVELWFLIISNKNAGP